MLCLVASQPRDVHAADMGADKPPIKNRAALVTPASQSAALLAIQCAGERAVAVGDHGAVLLSDDKGANWRQSRSVPSDVLLTGVSFVDAQHGWAVGHHGVVLHTEDGGETWTLQRVDMQADKPLFAVHFFDQNTGVAVGLWSLVLRTVDGGAHWTEVTLAPTSDGAKSDLNLYSLFADSHATLFATSERGRVLRSMDQGATWEIILTGNAGSLWTGTALTTDGSLVVAGLRGALLRSVDRGTTWQRMKLPLNESIAGLASLGSDRLIAVGDDGLVLKSGDGRSKFSAELRADRIALTGIVAGACASAETPIGLSLTGPVLLGKQ